jgi:type IV pilus assembly protein PilM
MAFFNSKSKNILGIDIGAGGIKLVEFRQVKSRPQLHTYAFTDRKLDELGSGLLEDPRAAAELLKTMMKQAKTTTVRAVAGLPGASVFSTTMSVPATSGKELKRAIEWQARKLIPLPIEEMILDWRILASDKEKKGDAGASSGLMPKPEKKQVFTKNEPIGPPELGGKEAMRVLLTGAAKQLVSKYVTFAKAAGLELVALETEVFALIRALIGKDPSRVLLIDFGSVRTSLVVVEAGVPVLTRSITLGGVSITRAIAKSLGVPEAEAEQMKRDMETLAPGSGTSGGSPQVLANVLEPLVTEVRYSLGLYEKQQGGDARVEKIVLTGGSSLVSGLAKHLSDTLNVNTYVGDPWARVGTHEDLRGVLDEIGPRFAVGVGLAMRDFE